MYGLTRATLTLIGAGVAGFLIWLGSTIAGDSPSGGEFWAFAGLAAAAGLVMAISQLLGGWTKWGWPRVSGSVFLLGFLPTLIVGGWIVAAGEPSGYWLGDHVRSWSGDIGVDGAVHGLLRGWTALAFGIGLVFGLTFDTTGPRVKRGTVAAGATQPVDGDGKTGDQRRVHIREGTPEPEAAPRVGEPAKK